MAKTCRKPHYRPAGYVGSAEFLLAMAQVATKLKQVHLRVVVVR